MSNQLRSDTPDTTKVNVLNLRLCQPRWEMHYADGTVKRSTFRYDLIRDDELTVLGFEAALYWPPYERYGNITEMEGPRRETGGRS